MLSAKPIDILCPSCGSHQLWRDGLRYSRVNRDPVQRWLCRDCGFRFSETSSQLTKELNIAEQLGFKSLQPGADLRKPPVRDLDFSRKKVLDDLSLPVSENVSSHNSSVVTVAGKTLNTLRSNSCNAEYCADEQKAKNLAEMQEIRSEKAAGATTISADINGKLIAFLWELKQQGLKERSIETYRHYLLQLIKHGGNLLDADSVKEAIVKQTWNENTKALAIASYTKFLQFYGGSWNPPKCKGVRKLPFIPLESELDALISGANRKMSAFLQLLKESGRRCGEALRLKWIEVDFKNGAIALNETEKYGKPRMFKISSALMAMLSILPKESDLIFGGQNPRNFGRIYRKYRNRMAFKLQNPRLKQISFHTFRHWKATMEYHRTKDILHVMQILGHRDIKTTLIYTQLIQFESDEFHSAVAKTIEEARSLVEAGFEYVTDIDGIRLFRKRK